MTPVSFFKLVGGPGSIGFLVFCSVIGIALIRVWPRRRTLGRWFLGIVYVGYVVMALPVVAQAIDAPFVEPEAGRDLAAQPIDAIIVFDGDNRVGRVDETLRLWSAAHPPLIIVSGAPWLVNRLVEGGIPVAHLRRDRDSATTREQVEYVKRYVEAHRDARVAIVASRLQAPRIAGLTRRAGIEVSLYPAPVDREPATSGVQLYVPAYAALRVSRDAIYERAALAYYAWRGWIDSRT